MMMMIMSGALLDALRLARFGEQLDKFREDTVDAIA